MKKLWALIIVLLLLAFYGVWPIWSTYQIYSAVKTKDAATLERKIDFPDVRVSLRDAATKKIAELYDRPQNQLPSSPVLIARIKHDAALRIVDAALENLVTADNLIRITSEGGQLREGVERMLRDQIIGGGDISGRVRAASPVIRTLASEEQAAAPSYGLGNVKSFAMLGLVRFEIGIAKYASAKEADLTAELSFTGTDWKLTAVRPRL